MANGGARPGAGRPTKADEEKVRNQAIGAIEKKDGSVEAGFDALLETKEPSLLKFVWEHAVGKPREKVDHDFPGGGPTVILQMPEGVKLEFPSNTDGE
jgi:hypothetical protein